MARIVLLKIVFQTPVSKRAKKNVVRAGRIDGPYRNREVEIETDIETGAGSNANLETRRIIFAALKKRKKGEKLFYVVAEFDGDGTINYFKTIVPRTEIPV